MINKDQNIGSSKIAKMISVMKLNDLSLFLGIKSDGKEKWTGNLNIGKYAFNVENSTFCELKLPFW